MYIFSYLILVLATSGFLLVASSQEISSALFSSFAEEQDYQWAFERYRDSLYQLASQYFEAFVNKYPNSIKRSDAEFLSAECLFQSAQVQNAAIKFNEFIQNNPNSSDVPDAFLRIGKSYVYLKRTSEAIASFKMVLDKYGDSESAGEAAYCIGEASLRNDDTQNALKYYTLAYENFPNNRFRDSALFFIAWTHQKRMEYAKASEWYSKLITEFSQCGLTPGAKIRIGECLYYAKDYKQAIDALTQSRTEIHAEDELVNVDYLIAEAYYKLRDFAESQKHFERFLMDHPNSALTAEVTYDLAWSLLNQKNYSASIEVFNKLVNRSDDLGQAALYRRGTAERSAGQLAIALKTFEEVITRDPQGDWSDYALFDAGTIFFEEKNERNAKECFRRLAAEFPKSDVFPDACTMVGDCLLIEGIFKEAQRWFTRALAVPAPPIEIKIEASFQSAFCSYKLKNFKDAAARFADFISQYPNHPKSDDAKFYQAEAEYQLGNYDKSRQLFQESAGRPGSAKNEQSLFGIARAYYRQKKFPQAIESFERLLAENPNSKYSLDTRIQLGDAHFFQMDYKKAIDIYRTVIRLYPDSIPIDYAYYQMGRSYLKDGDNSEAFKAFDGLIKALPRSPLADHAQFALGWINFRRNEYGEAIKEFRSLLKNFATSGLVPRTYGSLGDCYYKLQQYELAETSYREVLRQFPKSPCVENALMGIQNCLTALGKDTEAAEVLNDFVKANPNSPIRGALQLKTGDTLSNQKKYSEAASGSRTFDLPAFILTGISSTDVLPVEKNTLDDSVTVQRPIVKPYENIVRERKTLEVGISKREESPHVQENKYSGFAKTGIGTYFTPQGELQFGQSFQEYDYSLGGKYFMTKGYAPNTNRSSGNVTVSGGTTLSSSVPFLQHASLDSHVDGGSESFHFYGSETPKARRTISDYQLQVGLENPIPNYSPYQARISMERLDIIDSTRLTKEVQLNLNYQTSFPIASLPIYTKIHFMSATGGIDFLDLSAGIQNLWFVDMLFEGSFHWYWAKGMAGQDMGRLCPQITAHYQITVHHRLFMSYEPMILPMTLKSTILINRYLSSASIIRHEYISNSGTLGIESNWKEAIKSRISINVISAHDLPIFSDFAKKGIWTLDYGRQASLSPASIDIQPTIVTFCAEMVAKLNSNDYFASNILLRSTNDSFLGGKIPYTPAVEAWCSEIHKIGTEISVGAVARFCGERTSNLAGTATLSKYAVVDVNGEYTPKNFLTLTVGIKNFTDTQFETWRGYREFPITAQIDVRIRW